MATISISDLNFATQAFIQSAKVAAGAHAAVIRVAVVGGTAIVNTTGHRNTQVGLS